VLKIVSECRELVKLYHINRGGLGFLRHSVVDYLEVNELILKLQPTYRKHHSTETAVLWVLSDNIDRHGQSADDSPCSTGLYITLHYITFFNVA